MLCNRIFQARWLVLAGFSIFLGVFVFASPTKSAGAEENAEEGTTRPDYLEEWEDLIFKIKDARIYVRYFS